MFTYYFHVYVCVLAYMYVHTGMQKPTEVRRGCVNTLNWIYNYHVCCEENPGLLQKQKIALNH